MHFSAIIFGACYGLAVVLRSDQNLGNERLELPDTVRNAIDKDLLDRLSRNDKEWIIDNIDPREVPYFSRLESDQPEKSKSHYDLFIRLLLKTRMRKFEQIGAPRFLNDCYRPQRFIIDELLQGITVSNGEIQDMTSQSLFSESSVVFLSIETEDEITTVKFFLEMENFELDANDIDLKDFLISFTLEHQNMVIKALKIYDLSPTKHALAELWIGHTLLALLRKGFQFADHPTFKHVEVLNVMTKNFMVYASTEEIALAWSTPNGINTWNTLHVLSVLSHADAVINTSATDIVSIFDRLKSGKDEADTKRVYELLSDEVIQIVKERSNLTWQDNDDARARVIDSVAETYESDIQEIDIVVETVVAEMVKTRMSNLFTREWTVTESLFKNTNISMKEILPPTLVAN